VIVSSVWNAWRVPKPRGRSPHNYCMAPRPMKRPDRNTWPSTPKTRMLNWRSTLKPLSLRKNLTTKTAINPPRALKGNLASGLAGQPDTARLSLVALVPGRSDS
jgi:hypothetical protein